MEQAYVSQGTSIDKGENARLSSFVGAIAIADLIKTTLGPKGLDKILQKISPHDQGISVTNDGATILKSIHVDNAASRVLVDIARVQDDEVGDGTTSVAVFAGELLREAEHLLLEQHIHPQTVCDGYRIATNIARLALYNCSIPSTPNTNVIAFRNDLYEIAQTTLSSKLLNIQREHFATLAVNAVMRLRGSNNLDHIQIIKIPGGSLRDSYLESGFILGNGKQPGVGQPRKIKNAKILIANTSMDTDKIKIYGSRVKVDSIHKVADIEQAERDKMRKKVQKIINHKCNCFINRQLIYNFPESIFTEQGIMAIEHADFDGVERLAAVLGGEVVSTFDHPELVTLGECDIIEEILIGEEKVMRFGGCKAGEACTIVLRGSSSHALDEAERSLHDALAILTATIRQPRTVYGGGCSEISMSLAVEKLATQTPGKKAIAMLAYSRALKQLPTIVANNGGYDSAELITQICAAHAAAATATAEGEEDSSPCTAGLDMTRGIMGDMRLLGIRESYKSKLQVILSASEAAEMILRVDDIIKAAPRKRDEEMGY